MQHPFFLWTLTEAWDWLINVPALGFIVLLVVGIPLVLMLVFLALAILFKPLLTR